MLVYILLYEGNSHINTISQHARINGHIHSIIMCVCQSCSQQNGYVRIQYEYKCTGIIRGSLHVASLHWFPNEFPLYGLLFRHVSLMRLHARRRIWVGERKGIPYGEAKPCC